MEDQIKAIVGLGNPGRDYEETRHNAGFMVLDLLVEKYSRSPLRGTWSRKFQGQFCQAMLGVAENSAKSLYLIKPETFMNLSGQSVAELCRFYKLSPKEVLVVHDEVDLPFGTLRMKQGGGDGGHNGLKSLVKCLGGGDFYRLRVGVGKPNKMLTPDYSTAAWVLGKFSPDERVVLPELLFTAAEFALEAITSGMKVAQGCFHKSPNTCS